MTYGLQGHVGCVNAVAWNSKGSLLISGSDDTRVLFFLTSGLVILFKCWAICVYRMVRADNLRVFVGILCIVKEVSTKYQ